MKTKLLGMLWALMGVFVLTSCSDDDDDILASEVPTAVMNAFESKFPSVHQAEWELNKGYYVAEFWQSNIETKAWYDAKAAWKMTEFDYGKDLQSLPAPVRKAFMESKYSEWWLDEVCKYERTDLTFYFIQVGEMGQMDRNLYYKEDGTLLKEEPDKDYELTPDTKI